MNDEKKSAIWAVDAFAEDKKLQFATFKALAKLMPKGEATIEPVYVLSADQLRVPSASFQGQKKEYRLKAESILKSWVKSLKDPRLTSPTLLLEDLHSTHPALDVLLKHAKERRATLIAVGTRAKKGAQRFFFGSFAETLLLRSDIPVLIVNPNTPSYARKLSRILFPTDFSEGSHSAFQSFLPVAQSLAAKVTLYCKIQNLADVPLVIRTHSIPSYSSDVRIDFQNKQSAATQWSEEGTREKVMVDVIFDEKPSRVSEGILKQAKKSNADLIAIASHSGAFSSTLIGSVTREVVRMAPIPVWVIHPKRKILG